MVSEFHEENWYLNQEAGEQAVNGYRVDRSIEFPKGHDRIAESFNRTDEYQMQWRNVHPFKLGLVAGISCNKVRLYFYSISEGDDFKNLLRHSSGIWALQFNNIFNRSGLAGLSHNRFIYLRITITSDT